ncbi:MAG: hypothetical protein KBT87_12910 [Gammaproteobacteria bacterium]|jgi:ABC-type Fe3+ transport system permease subunit|nr:hypothetical protein [Gammaproteobacteria bacterium]MBQ0775569.1 hypothetical protein [Gammaproteobacteria bacterium]
MDLFGLGLNSYDVALMVVCPISAVVGSFAQTIVQTIDLKGPPRSELDMTWASPKLQEFRSAWLGLRLILGAILGLVIGLYFVGAIQESPAVLAKIAALSVLAGYAAPKVWAAQDKVVSAKIDKIVSLEIDKQAASNENQKDT